MQGGIEPRRHNWHDERRNQHFSSFLFLCAFAPLREILEGIVSRKGAKAQRNAGEVYAQLGEPWRPWRFSF